ncbi:MAG TPA: hypothetical protein VLA02_00835 [Reyranella sp.]|nr:hypothetical protein [Reyranella sp.]
MRNAKWLLAALGLVTLTAGCVQETTTYHPSPAYQNRSSSGGYWNSARRDYDRDGIPNRYDRDANGDRIPDRYQGR